MEGQRQPGREEALSEREFRELLAQVQESFRELGDLEERWGGPNPQGRRAQLREIDQRIIEHIERWKRFPYESPAQIHELDQKIIELNQQRKRFPYQSTTLRRLQGIVVLLSLPVPRITISGEHIRDNNIIFSCPACLEQFRLGQDACELECGHMYHHTCILLWFENSHVRCPACLSEIRQAVEAMSVRPLLPREIMAVAVPPLMPRIHMTVTISISDEQISDNNRITSSCPICHDDFELGEDADQLHCGHIYHHSCISSWMEIGNTCPICRKCQ